MADETSNSAEAKAAQVSEEDNFSTKEIQAAHLRASKEDGKVAKPEVAPFEANVPLPPRCDEQRAKRSAAKKWVDAPEAISGTGVGPLPVGKSLPKSERNEGASAVREEGECKHGEDQLHDKLADKLSPDVPMPSHKEGDTIEANIPVDSYNAASVADGELGGTPGVAAIHPGAVSVPGPQAGEHCPTETQASIRASADDFEQEDSILIPTAYLPEETQVAACAVVEDLAPSDLKKKQKDPVCCRLVFPCCKVQVPAMHSSKRKFIIMALLGAIVVGAALGILAGAGAFNGKKIEEPIIPESEADSKDVRTFGELTDGVVCSRSKVFADDAKPDTMLGQRVALDGNTMVVGAQNDDGTKCAYVFVRSKMGYNSTWHQQAKLLPDVPISKGINIWSASVSGNTAIVGYGEDDKNGIRSGSAYVFTRNGTRWSQQAKLIPTDGAEEDMFGYSIDLEKDVAVISAPHRHTDKGIGTTHYNDKSTYDSTHGGYAYIFRRKGETWTQEAKLQPSDTEAEDEFGFDVAVSGNFVAVSSMRDDSVYVFAHNGLMWILETKLRPHDLDEGDHFGQSLAFDSDVLVIGSKFEDTNAKNSGSAYIFTRAGTMAPWEQKAKLIPNDGRKHLLFGQSVALSGNTVVVGTSGGDERGEKAGSAYVFRFINNETTWKQVAKLVPDDLKTKDRFGWSLAVDGDTVAIGAAGSDDRGEGSGKVYTMELC